MNPTKFDKAGIVGYSMGTNMLLTGLADRYDFYKYRTYKVALITPCTITEPTMYALFNTASVNLVESLDVFSFGGPDWY